MTPHANHFGNRRAAAAPRARMVRRKRIAHANQHAASYYVSFTQILMTLISRPETTK
jgi:hypothetical protein